MFGNMTKFGRQFPSSKKTSVSGPVHRRRLRLESLERREMMTGSPIEMAARVAAPAAPALTATAGSTSQINLSWTSSSGATSYLVDELVNGSWKQIGSFGSGTKSDAVTGLAAGTTYEFEVGASNSGGTTWSKEVGATTLKAAPAAPVATATAVSGTQVDLSWNAVAGATGYLVDEWNGSAWQQIGSFGAGTKSDAITGLSPGTTYYFDVAATNSAGTTWEANYNTVTTPQSAPAAPVATATAVSGTQVDLSWNAVAGATGYLVDEWNGSAWQQIGSFGAGTTSDAITGLSAGTTYYFDVAATNSAGTTWEANYNTVTTPQAAPVAPSFTATAVSNSQINLVWGAAAGATGYLVDEWTGSAWQQIGSFGSNTTSDAVTGLSSGISYQFRVGADNSTGTSWATSQSVYTPVSESSSNWSGYVVTPPSGQQFTNVSGSFVQPAFTSTGTNSGASIWVGINGWEGSTVEQIGTSWNASNNTYVPWVEFYGDSNGSANGTYYYEYDLNNFAGNSFNIQPGDTIQAQVVYVSSTSTTSTFAFQFSDTSSTSGQTTSWQGDLTTQYVVPARSCAEWIAEAPGLNGVEVPLADFGAVQFTDCDATSAGSSASTTGPIDAFANYLVDMIPNGVGGGGTDTTSYFATSASQFSIAFDGGASSAAAVGSAAGLSMAGAQGGVPALAGSPLSASSPAISSTTASPAAEGSSKTELDPAAVDGVLVAFDLWDGPVDAASPAFGVVGQGRLLRHL